MLPGALRPFGGDLAREAPGDRAVLADPHLAAHLDASRARGACLAAERPGVGVHRIDGRALQVDR